MNRSEGKYALVGLGYWGPKLLRNLIGQVGMDRVVVVDNHVGRLGEIEQQYPALEARLSIDDVLEDHDVSAVVLATPLATHAPLGRMALDAGKHLFVEKPLASSVEDGFDLVNRAMVQDKTLMVGHTFLFSPRVDQIMRYVDEGQLGQIQYVTSSRLNLGLHRQDANVIWDLAPHDFSILFRVLGELPVSAQTTAAGSAGVPEVAFINLIFPSGAIASVTLSWLAPRKVRNAVFVGDQRMVVYEDDQPDEPIKLYDKGVIAPDGATFASHQLTYRYGQTIAPHIAPIEPLDVEVAHFIDCVELGTPCISDGYFGVAVVEALEAADRSWREGGVPVALTNMESPIRAVRLPDHQTLPAALA